MRPRVRLTLLGPALAVLLLVFPRGATAAPSNGGPVTPQSAGWVEFQWSEDGIAGPFVYTTDGTLYFDVTDSFCRGDQFSIADNGVVIGTTSSVPIDYECDDLPMLQTPIKSYQDSTYSSGEFVLGPGSHSIVITAIVNYFGGGSGFFGAWESPAP